MRCSSGFAIAPFSSSAMASNAFAMGAAMRWRKSSGNFIRETSSVTPIESQTQSSLR
jgi:hypothetical protein